MLGPESISHTKLSRFLRKIDYPIIAKNRQCISKQKGNNISDSRLCRNSGSQIKSKGKQQKIPEPCLRKKNRDHESDSKTSLNINIHKKR